ncbi:hypothetical protein ACQP2F_15920 [Actinoplanes sp. CA-030573]|uniref:hypothetical protein n=1 Tax=Actinoplanes sp. CA-030573 TaxID=3239898 RepID=UPI003D904C13
MSTLEMIRAISHARGVKIPGVGLPDANTSPAAVWIPESSLVLNFLKYHLPGFAASDTRSTASTPTIFGASDIMINGLLPNARMTPAELDSLVAHSERQRVGIADPMQAYASLSYLASKASLTQSTDYQGLPPAVSAVDANVYQSSEALLQDFTPIATVGGSFQRLSLAPMSESDLVNYNAEHPTSRLQAIYPEPSLIAQDFPFSVMPGVSDSQRDAASALYDALRTPTVASVLSALGLRQPDGSVAVNPTIRSPQSAPSSMTEVPNLGDLLRRAPISVAPQTISECIRIWSALTEPRNVLALFDVSSASGTYPSGTADQTRLDLSRNSTINQLKEFDRRWYVGTGLILPAGVNSGDYARLTDVAPLYRNSGNLHDDLGRIRSEQSARGDLCRATLSAYIQLAGTPSNGNKNLIVAFVSVRGAEGSVGRVDELRRAIETQSRVNPITAVFVAVGGTLDSPDLQQVASSTGGGVISVKSAYQVDDLWQQILALTG